jgi:alkylation response protein AidB-like acyl-CoA dehydrogenase
MPILRASPEKISMIDLSLSEDLLELQARAQRFAEEKVWSIAPRHIASNMHLQAATNAAQAFGGYGYMKNCAVAKLMCDARLLQICEGTNKIRRMVIVQ